MRVVIPALLVLLAGACATRTQRWSMVPTELVGLDGSWLGVIREGSLRVVGAGEAIIVTDADVLAPGRGTILLNSRVPGGRYVSLWVEPAECEAAGRRASHRVGICISPDRAPRGARCDVRLNGCAYPIFKEASPRRWRPIPPPPAE